MQSQIVEVCEATETMSVQFELLVINALLETAKVNTSHAGHEQLTGEIFRALNKMHTAMESLNDTLATRQSELPFDR